MSIKGMKQIVFIYLSSHDKNLKTTVFGMTGHVPDSTMLMVNFRKSKKVFKENFLKKKLFAFFSVFLA
jgi:GTPase